MTAGAVHNAHITYVWGPDPPLNFLEKVGNVPKDSLGQQMVVNTRLELCGAILNRINVTYVNYTVKGNKKGR